jgi:hypothetical protein
VTSSSAALPSACPDEASGAPFTLSGLSAVCRNFCARSRTRGAYVHQAAMFTRRRLPHPMRHGGAHWGHGVYRTQTVRRLWLSVPASAGRRVMSSRSARDDRRVAISPPPVRNMQHKRCGLTALDGEVGSPSHGSVAAGPAGPPPTIQCPAPDSGYRSHLTGAQSATYCNALACTRPYVTVSRAKMIFRVIET